MPTYTIQTPDGRHVDIEANDEQTAIRGAQEWAGSHQASAAPSMGRDVAKSAQAGAVGAGFGLIQGNPIFDPVGFLAHQARVNGKIIPGLNKVADFLEPAGAGAEASRLGGDYAPQTLPGKLTKAGVSFLPAAAMPGTALARAAAVALPAVGSVAGREGVKALGGGETAQAIGEFAGGLAGGAGVGARIPKLGVKPSAPSLESLQAARTAAYKAVDDMGVTYKPEAVNTLVQGVNDAMEQGLIDPDLHRGATALTRKVNQLTEKPVTLTRLEQVRKVVGNQIADKATTKDDRRLLYTIRDNIDQFVGAAGPDQVSVMSGDPAQAAQALQNARELHARTAKIEAVNTAVEQAKERAGSTGSGGNIDNATRQELRKVLKYQRGLTEDETTQLRSAIFGDPRQNALRLAGKFSPSGNGLTAMLQTGGAVATHGATLPFMAGGMIAKAGADAITRNKVAGLIDTMARGGTKAVQAENTLAQLAKGNPQARLAYDQVAKRLLLTGGLAASSALAPMQSAAREAPKRQ